MLLIFNFQHNSLVTVEALFSLIRKFLKSNSISNHNNQYSSIDT